jgi:small subunit ribosomal protein S6
LAERVYEGMFLLDANKYSRDPSGVSGRVGEMIEKCGGEILVGRLWAEQKLAYQIGNHRKGAYWLTYFRADVARVSELTRATQLNGDVIRHMVMTVDPRLVETLVRHAQGQVTEKAPVVKEKAEKEPVAAAAGKSSEPAGTAGTAD